MSNITKFGATEIPAHNVRVDRVCLEVYWYVSACDKLRAAMTISCRILNEMGLLLTAIELTGSCGCFVIQLRTSS